MPLNAGLPVQDIPEVASRGLRTPRVVTLWPGQILFRFASTSQPNTHWAAGPWWMHEQDYRRIIAVHDAGQNKHKGQGLTLGFLGRAAMAVQPSWSRTDVVVKAVVQQEILAFAGAGRTQYREQLPNGMFLTLAGWPDVEQLFIPNIGDRNGRTAVGRQALLVTKQKVISSQQLS